MSFVLFKQIDYSMGYSGRCAVPQHWVNALRSRLLGRALLRLKPSRRCDSMGHYERYAVPQHWVNALRSRLLGRALLRLKPSRRWESMGYSGRCAVPQHWVNALRARLLGGPCFLFPLTARNKPLYNSPARGQAWFRRRRKPVPRKRAFGRKKRGTSYETQSSPAGGIYPPPPRTVFLCFA